MRRKVFKELLKECTYSHFTFQKISMRIDGDGNLQQLDEEEKTETWKNVDTGRLGEQQKKGIIEAAKNGAIII